jgi:Na+/H+ antiporter NhaD/arsenite permease-like protein
LIGGAMAHQLFRGNVHIGYLAAIVAASNAGGSWSVLGDTTTTMMWIAGVSPHQVFEAIIASVVALIVFGIPAAMKQHRHSPILKHAHEHVQIDWMQIGIVILILALATNVTVNTKFPSRSSNFPFIGVAVWAAILISIGTRRPDWEVLPRALRSSIFLLSLVLIPSMMPVERLPNASPQTALGLGFLSSVFDNIPLTALALKQGGYDWGSACVCSGIWRVHDLVWVIRRGCDFEHFSRGKIGHRVGKGGVLCDYRLPNGVRCNANGDRVAPRTEWLAEPVTSVEAKKAPWQHG